MTTTTQPKSPGLSAYALGVNANIKAECARQDLSVAAIAEAFGVSDDSITRRRTGRLAWTLDEIAAVASMLKVNPAELTNVTGVR